MDTWTRQVKHYFRNEYEVVITWKWFPYCWPFVWGIHWSPLDFPSQWASNIALMLSLLDLRLHDTHVTSLWRRNKFEFHRSQVILTYFTTKNTSNSFFCTWPHQFYESSKCGIYTYKMNLSAPIDFCYSWPIFGPGGLKHSLLWGINLKLVYTLSRLHNVLYWFHASPEWGPCDLLQFLCLGTVN